MANRVARAYDRKQGNDEGEPKQEGEQMDHVHSDEPVHSVLFGELENDSDGEGDAKRKALFELAKKKGVDVYQVLTETFYALTTPTHYATKRRYDPILPEAEEYLLASRCGNVSSRLNNARGQLSSLARLTRVPVAKVVNDFNQQIAVVEKSERETF